MSKRGTFDPRRDAKDVLRRLRQLVRGMPNVLVVDASRDFVNDDDVRTALEATGGAFARHAELSGVLIQRWGGWSPAVHESYVYIASNHADAVALTPRTVDALVQERLAASTPGCATDKQAAP